jgi:hypothetical protein
LGFGLPAVAVAAQDHGQLWVVALSGDVVRLKNPSPSVSTQAAGRRPAKTSCTTARTGIGPDWVALDRHQSGS